MAHCGKTVTGCKKQVSCACFCAACNATVRIEQAETIKDLRDTLEILESAAELLRGNVKDFSRNVPKK
jgi:hypothetical protein